MPEVIPWPGEEPRAVIRRAVQLLARGRLVVFPTDTVYQVAASPLIPAGVARLPQVDAAAGEQPVLAVQNAGDLADWAPAVGRLGLRFARRAWPGPLILACPADLDQGLLARLEESVRRSVAPERIAYFGSPNHDVVLAALDMLAAPLLLADVTANGIPAATTATEAATCLGDQVDLVIDAGPTPLGHRSTVVRVEGDRWGLVREGPMSAEAVAGLTPCRIVFVCTGNTCRSPLAEALCRKLLAERLGCSPDELPRRGFVVQSAGIAAMMEEEASPQAVAVARALGADLSGHRSQPVTRALLAQADHLIGMTQSHLRAILSYLPPGGVRPRLLAADDDEVVDPLGCAEEVYHACAQQILKHLEKLLPEVQKG
jgi:L-threonylcarbamoyladenylate synthase